MPNLPEILSEYQGNGYVIAPAGFGKTHLIAEAIKVSETRQLVLTHTHAGVDALKKKLRKLEVESTKYNVETIASYALRLCLSYPVTANWNINTPNSAEDWNRLYSACIGLIGQGFVKKVILASYSGIYVDEYQDCTQSHHDMICAFSKILPVRVLGDPLQAIFNGIGGQNVVDWNTQLIPHFECLGELTIPHRWIHGGDSELGQWLREVREIINADGVIDLRNGLPQSVSLEVVETEDELRNKQISICKWGCRNKEGRIIAIHKGDNQHKSKCQILAKNTGGIFSSIEEVEGKRLSTFIRNYSSKSTAQEKLLCTIQFLKDKSFSGVTAALSAATIRGDNGKIQTNTKNPMVVQAANEFLQEPLPHKLYLFLQSLKDAPETTLYARDLFYRLLKVINIQRAEQSISLEDAQVLFQRQFRHTGRPISFPKLIGTTLLVKGQEYDHGIVLDASSLSKKDLYVALTRGCKSLTIISKTPTLKPT